MNWKYVGKKLLALAIIAIYTLAFVGCVGVCIKASHWQFVFAEVGMAILALPALVKSFKYLIK